MAALFDDATKEIPGYKVILKSVIKSQIQHLVEQLATATDEESVILTASVADGSLSHLGSESGKDFLRDHDDLKLQFLGFCLKNFYERKQLGRLCREQQPNIIDSYSAHDFGNCETYTATTFIPSITSDSICNTSSTISCHKGASKSSRSRFEPYIIPKPPKRPFSSLPQTQIEIQNICQSDQTRSIPNESKLDDLAIAGMGGQSLEQQVTAPDEIPTSVRSFNSNSCNINDRTSRNVMTNVSEIADRSESREFGYHTHAFMPSCSRRNVQSTNKTTECDLNTGNTFEHFVDRHQENNTSPDVEDINQTRKMNSKSNFQRQIETTDCKLNSKQPRADSHNGDLMETGSEQVEWSRNDNVYSKTPIVTERENNLKKYNDGDTYVSKLRSSRSLHRKYEVNHAVKVSMARKTTGKVVARSKKQGQRGEKLEKEDISSNMSDTSLTYTESEYEDVKSRTNAKGTVSHINKNRCSNVHQNVNLGNTCHIDSRIKSRKNPNHFDTLHKRASETVFAFTNATRISQSNRQEQDRECINSTRDKETEQSRSKQESASDSESELEIIAVEPGKVFLFKDTCAPKLSKSFTSNYDRRKKTKPGRKRGGKKAKKTSNTNEVKKYDRSTFCDSKDCAAVSHQGIKLRSFKFTNSRYDRKSSTTGFFSDQEPSRRACSKGTKLINFHIGSKNLKKTEHDTNLEMNVKIPTVNEVFGDPEETDVDDKFERNDLSSSIGIDPLKALINVNTRKEDTSSLGSISLSVSESDDSPDDSTSESSASTGVDQYPKFNNGIAQATLTVNTAVDNEVNTGLQSSRPVLDLQVTRVEPAGSIWLKNMRKNKLLKTESLNVFTHECRSGPTSQRKKHRFDKLKHHRKPDKLLRRATKTGKDHYCWGTNFDTNMCQKNISCKKNVQSSSIILTRFSLDSRMKSLSINNSGICPLSCGKTKSGHRNIMAFGYCANTDADNENADADNDKSRNLMEQVSCTSNLDKFQKIDKNSLSVNAESKEGIKSSVAKSGTVNEKRSEDKVQTSSIIDSETVKNAINYNGKNDQVQKCGNSISSKVTSSNSPVLLGTANVVSINVTTESVKPQNDSSIQGSTCDSRRNCSDHVLSSDKDSKAAAYIATSTQPSNKETISGFRQLCGFTCEDNSGKSNLSRNTDIPRENGKDSKTKIFVEKSDARDNVDNANSQINKGYENSVEETKEEPSRKVNDVSSENMLPDLNKHNTKDNKSSSSLASSPPPPPPSSTTSSSSLPEILSFKEYGLEEISNSVTVASQNNKHETGIADNLYKYEEQNVNLDMEAVAKNPLLQQDKVLSGSKTKSNPESTTTSGIYQQRPVDGAPDLDSSNLNGPGERVVPTVKLEPSEKSLAPAVGRNSDVDAKPNVGEVTNARYTCDTCGMLFRFKSTLTIHMRVHTGERPYKCEQCNKSFTQKAALNRHMTVHSKTQNPTCRCYLNRRKRKCPRKYTMESRSLRRFFCKLCGRRYLLKTSLEKHIEEIHGNDKCNKCHLCGTCSKCAIKRDSERQYFTERDPVSCGKASTIVKGQKSFDEKIDFKPVFRNMNNEKNLRSFGKDDDGAMLAGWRGRKYGLSYINTTNSRKCDFCEKLFESETVLKNHIRTNHYGELFKCPWCRKRFTKEGNRNSHRGECQKSRSSGSDDTETEERRNYRCEKCGSMYVRKAQLQMHMDIVHSQKHFECNECRKKFRYKSCLNRHVKLNHLGYYSSQI